MGSASIPIHALRRARRWITTRLVVSILGTQLVEGGSDGLLALGAIPVVRAVLTTTLCQRSLRGSRFGRIMTLSVPSPLPKPDQPVGQPGASGSPQHAEHRADNEQLADARARLCV